MRILDPLSPFSAASRATAAIVAVLVCLFLLIAGLAGGPFQWVYLISAVAGFGGAIAGIAVFVSRQNRLRALLPHANEMLRRRDLSVMAGDAIACVIDASRQAVTDEQDRSLLRRHAAKASARWSNLPERWLNPTARRELIPAPDEQADQGQPFFDPALVDFIREPARTALEVDAWTAFLCDLGGGSAGFRNAGTVTIVTARLREAFASLLRDAILDHSSRSGNDKHYVGLELAILGGLLGGVKRQAGPARQMFPVAGIAKLTTEVSAHAEKMIDSLAPAEQERFAAPIARLRERLTELAATADVQETSPVSSAPSTPAHAAPNDFDDQFELDAPAQSGRSSLPIVPERKAQEVAHMTDGPPITPQLDLLREQVEQQAGRRDEYVRRIPGFDITAERVQALEAIDALGADAQGGDAEARAVLEHAAPAAAADYLARRRERKLEQLRALYDEIVADNARLASVAVVLGDLPTAEAALAQVVSGRPNDLHALSRLAQVMHLQGRLDEAERHLQRLLDLCGQDESWEAVANNQLGQLARSRGDIDSAEERFRRALNIYERAGWRDGVAGGYCNLGLVYLAKNDPERAAEMFRGAAAASDDGPLRVKAIACGQLGILYRAKKDFIKAEQMLRASADAYVSIGLPAAAAGHLNTLGLICKQRGDLDRAESAYRHAAALNERCENAEGLATNCGNLADVAMARCDAESAETLLRRSIDLFEQASSQEGVAAAYGKLGAVLHEKGELSAAVDALQIALAIDERLGASERMSVNLATLGLIYQQRGDPRQAEPVQVAALALSEQLGDAQSIGANLNNLGVTAEQLGEMDRALDLFTRAMAINERHGEPAELARTCTNLGNLHLARNELKAAEELLTRAMLVHEDLGSLQGIAANCGNLATIFQARGEMGHAEEMIRSAILALAKLGNEDGLAVAHAKLAGIYRSRGDLPHAAEMYREAIALDARRGAEDDVASHCGNLGLIYRSLGNLEEAEEVLRRALNLFEKLGRDDNVAVTYSHLGTVAMERGHAPNARAMWSRAMELYQKLGKLDTARTLRGRLETLEAMGV